MSAASPRYERIDCPCCGGSESRLFARGTELDTFRHYSQFPGFEECNFVICTSCSLVYSNPRLLYTDTTIATLFPEHVARREKRRADNIRKGKFKSVRPVNLLASMATARGRWLEIGCGFGDALLRAKELGFDAVGTELYPGYVESCRERGLDVRLGKVDSLDFESGAFDAVYMEDVVEHLKQPFSFMADAIRLLRPGGVLFVHTWAIKMPTDVIAAFGEAWRADLNLDLAAHTTVFPHDTLERFLRENGMDIWGFESFLWNVLPGQEAPEHRCNFVSLYCRKC